MTDLICALPMKMGFNPLPNDEILDLSKFKAFARRQNNSDLKIEICVGKGKLSFAEVLKVGIVW